MSIYVSEKDSALSLTRFLTRRERLGQMWIKEMRSSVADYLYQNEAEVSVINVTEAKWATAGNDHDYFRRSPCNGCLATSPGGLTWTERTAALSAEGAVLTDVIWTGAAFVALGNINRGKFGMTTVVFTSADGSAWTRQSVANAFLMSLTWNGSLFIGVGGVTRQGSIFSSADGKSWTRSRVQVSAPLRSVAWNGKRFVAVGVRGEIHTSPDGQAWTKRSSNTTRDLLRVAWNSTHFVAVGRGIILRSADGMMWE